MNNRTNKNVFYIEQEQQNKIPKRKRKWKKLKFFNILMLFLAVYFVVTIARQEFKLWEIKAETEKANAQVEELKQQEGIVTKKIADASSSHMISNKAKSILGWVKEGETKVIAE